MSNPIQSELFRYRPALVANHRADCRRCDPIFGARRALRGRW